ncbi:hypothetical protein GIB67_007731 [Kingdonia uniflora]|uniref:Inhibitor I9 domain-containing protein n=1 Tax=Kingdonia uniflora TaxID=39325 RepID=A0A7J7N232_9MAGN|nr:hypothetical protein GIB67_007731 [Kingdonia uniflora]
MKNPNTIYDAYKDYVKMSCSRAFCALERETITYPDGFCTDEWEDGACNICIPEATMGTPLLIYSILIFTLSTPLYSALLKNDRKDYIVYMGAHPKRKYSPLSHLHSILQQVLENSSSSDTNIYSYKRSFNGFAAKLTDQERQKLASKKLLTYLSLP